MSRRRRVTLGRLHALVIAETFEPELSNDDALLVMALLHCYQFVVKPGTLTDVPQGGAAAAITQRHAAEVVAQIWKGAGERGQPTYWYWQWNGDWGSYGHLDRLTAAERDRLRELKERIEAHPLVARLQPEDWDLVGGPAATPPSAAD